MSLFLNHIPSDEENRLKKAVETLFKDIAGTIRKFGTYSLACTRKMSPISHIPTGHYVEYALSNRYSELYSLPLPTVPTILTFKGRVSTRLSVVSGAD